MLAAVYAALTSVLHWMCHNKAAVAFSFFKNHQHTHYISKAVTFWAIVIWSIFIQLEVAAGEWRGVLTLCPLRLTLRADAPQISRGLCHTSCSTASWMTQTSAALQEKRQCRFAAAVVAAAMKRDGGGRAFLKSLLQGRFTSYITVSFPETLQNCKNRNKCVFISQLWLQHCCCLSWNQWFLACCAPIMKVLPLPRLSH